MTGRHFIWSKNKTILLNLRHVREFSIVSDPDRLLTLKIVASIGNGTWVKIQDGFLLKEAAVDYLSNILGGAICREAS
jgi:hypothetical protein